MGSALRQAIGHQRASIEAGSSVELRAYAVSDGPAHVTEEVPLVLLTINLQYYATWPKDTCAACRRVSQLLSAEPRPDVICVQEGLEGRDVFGQHGYRKLLSSAAHAQSLRDMVYGHEATLAAVAHESWDQLLVNELYVRDPDSSGWEVVGQGMVRTASEVSLVGGDGVSGPLASRSAVWVQLRPKGFSSQVGPSVTILNTHLSGGRFEDQFFVQQLSEERALQVTRSLDFFEQRRGPLDLGILVGDFNATTEDRADGPVEGYFRSSVRSSPRVQEDALAAQFTPDELEAQFKTYMAAPFTALRQRGWPLAYTQDDVGATSAFGHCVDHMATSRPVRTQAEVFKTTLQRFGGGAPDTDLPLTDHNAVKVCFHVPAYKARPAPQDSQRVLRQGAPSDEVVIQEPQDDHSKPGAMTKAATSLRTKLRSSFCKVNKPERRRGVLKCEGRC